MADFWIEFDTDEPAAMTLDQWDAVDSYGPVFVFGGRDPADPFWGSNDLG